VFRTWDLVQGGLGLGHLGVKRVLPLGVNAGDGMVDLLLLLVEQLAQLVNLLLGLLPLSFGVNGEVVLLFLHLLNERFQLAPFPLLHGAK
jgi:hypothetical protein